MIPICLKQTSLYLDICKGYSEQLLRISKHADYGCIFARGFIRIGRTLKDTKTEMWELNCRVVAWSLTVRPPTSKASLPSRSWYRNFQRLSDSAWPMVPRASKIEININASFSTRFYSPSLLSLLSDDQKCHYEKRMTASLSLFLQKSHHL